MTKLNKNLLHTIFVNLLIFIIFVIKNKRAKQKQNYAGDYISVCQVIYSRPSKKSYVNKIFNVSRYYSLNDI